MKTNYQNLEGLEAAAVVIASIGVFLIGGIAYSGLRPDQQAHVAAAFSMFDLHEDFKEQGELLKTITVTVPQQGLDEFYLAFSELATISDESIGWWQTVGQQTTIAFSSVLELSDRTAVAFNAMVEHNNQIFAPQPRLGNVAGIMVESTETKPAPEFDPDILINILPPPPPGFKPPVDPRAHGYTPPFSTKEMKEMISPIKF